jgi:CheY-like chemotaxis protein
MGGTFEVESRLGEGSRFLVKLPVERAPEPDLTPQAAAVGSIILEPGEPEYRVLIVEDDEDSRVLLERLVRNAGFQVEVSSDGAHGVELFRTWRPHFIWMDLQMSGMDGVETTRQIRELEGGRDVKIAAVSASVFADERNRVLASGLDDFVAKPYRSDEIFSCLACQLGVRYHRIEPAPAAAEPAGALRQEALGALPEELRVELRDALIALDAGRIALVIGRVSEQDSALGSVLARRADRFAYTAIFEALEAGRHNRPAESR